MAGHDILPEVPLDVLPLPELGDSILPTEKAASTRECKGSTEEGASGVEKAEQQLGPNMANLEVNFTTSNQPANCILKNSK